MRRRILQICPHDTAPFDVLCERYVKAGEHIGVDVVTLFLAPSGQIPLSFAEYLNHSDLSKVTEIRKALAEYADTVWDLVICHRYRAYWSAVGTKLTLNPCVVLAHEFGLLKRWQRRLNRVLLARSFQFAGVSPPVAAELKRIVGEAVVLPNVLDTDAAENNLLTRDAARRELGLRSDSFVVGVVGRLHYKKRPAFALEAFRLFSGIPHMGNARLVFVGDGDIDLGGDGVHDENVHFTGNIFNAARIFSAFDVLLHPARVEAFGMVVLEALYAGIPVVTLPSSGPQFILGNLGVYAEADTPAAFAAAIQRSMTVDRNQYEKQARQRIENQFSIPSLARALEAMIAESI